MARKAPVSLKKRLDEGIAAASAQNLLRKYVDYGEDSRFMFLHNREAYYRGTQYNNRPYDWTGSNQSFTDYHGAVAMSLNGAAPVANRKPRGQYDLGRVIINRFTALLCGETRFPTFRVSKSQPTEDFLNALSEQVLLRASFTECANLGGAVGSVVVMFRVENGDIKLEMFNSKYVMIEDWIDFPAGEMGAFAVTYPYKQQVYNAEKKVFEDKWFISKRIVTDTVDVSCKPIPAKYDDTKKFVTQDNPEYTPEIDYEKSWVHDYGLVPAQFIQNLPLSDQIDGDPSIECTYSLIDMINEQLSAAHGGLLANLDPTLLLKMAPEDYKKLSSMGGTVQKGSAAGVAIVVGDKGDGKYLEITGEGIKLSMEMIGMLRQFALEVADCVIADPHRITGAAQSAAAIAKLYASMLAKCDLLRTQYGEGMKRLLSKITRVFVEQHGRTVIDDLGDKPRRVTRRINPIQGVDPKTDKVIQLRPEDHISNKDIKLIWGDYFEATAADTFQAVEAAVMALGGKAVTSRAAAVKYIANFLGDPDPVRTLVTVEEEAAADLAHEKDMATLGKAAQPKGTAPKSGASRTQPSGTADE